MDWMFSVFQSLSTFIEELVVRPKGIESELTSRTFVPSLFGLRGLDLVRKRSVIPSYAGLLWRQAKSSSWRDAALEWLEAALPPRKGHSRPRAQPEDSQRPLA